MRGFPSKRFRHNAKLLPEMPRWSGTLHRSELSALFEYLDRRVHNRAAERAWARLRDRLAKNDKSPKRHFSLPWRIGCTPGVVGRILRVASPTSTEKPDYGSHVKPDRPLPFPFSTKGEDEGRIRYCSL